MSIKIWLTGFYILILYALLGEIVIYFQDYIYTRLDLNRNYILLFLWILPILASFYVSYNEENYKIIYSLSYVLILPLIVAFFHYLNGKAGGSVDFITLKGLVEIVKIYFFISLLLCGIGSFLGFILSKEV